jgi:hypothetical protein
VLQRRPEVERHQVWSLQRHHPLEVNGANRLHPGVDSPPNVGLVHRSWCGHRSSFRAPYRHGLDLDPGLGEPLRGVGRKFAGCPVKAEAASDALGRQCRAQLFDRRVVCLIHPWHSPQRNIEAIEDIDHCDSHHQREELIVAERLPHFLIDSVRDTVIGNQSVTASVQSSAARSRSL